MDVNKTSSDTSTINDQTTVNASRIRRLQSVSPLVINVPVITKISPQVAAKYKDGTTFVAKQNDGKTYNCIIKDREIYYSKDEYTKV